VTYRGSGTVTTGDVVAFPTDYVAYTNDSAAVSFDKTSSNYIWANVDTMSQSDSEVGILAVVVSNGTFSATQKLIVCLFDPLIDVKVIGGASVTEAAGHFLFANKTIGTPNSVTAKQLAAHPRSNLDALTVPTRCYGFTHEAAPDDAGSAATKKCFFVGTGYFTAGGGA
jgi:hypothetical protein